ncbi:hypothetical protein ACFFMN_23030 [Planobispora siamensis]|uniref:Uncharacterized protein n=1 Tax=Planobispora siamensis TaxID=936338 RepID=A0A8J3SM92_9ACTN|nr:hypothetical protein [Planobispora siamensis]GIH95442.1 hypothetical protein Psi01_60720 [Planobispora siamensis]
MRQAEQWTLHHELLAQVIEVVSILAAEMRIKKPIQIPRPSRPANPRARTGKRGTAHAVAVLKQAQANRRASA